jgi:hypothetical protein
MKEFKILIFLLIALPFAKPNCAYDQITLERCLCEGYEQNFECNPFQVCGGWGCSDAPKCPDNSPASSKCVCEDSTICEEGKMCTSDGSCIDPPPNIPTTIPTTFLEDISTTDLSTMSTNFPEEKGTSNEATGNSSNEIENTSEGIGFESQDKGKKMK